MNRSLYLTLALALPCLAAGADDREGLRFFESAIRPLLSAECYDCHGPEKSKNGLRLDHRDFIVAGGDSGPAIVPGKAEESLLVEAVRRGDPDFSMPPKTALAPEQVADLEKWIALGAPWPEEKATRSETDEHGFTDEDRKWWAVQPLAEVEVPENGADWAKNEIDPFVFRALEASNLTPAEPAEASELVRRIHFDLHGLPPAPEEAAAFAEAYAKDADAAVAELVDRLLESPRYGERWGQHWLDVARYAESDGYRADGYRPDAWRYRDYVIRSFNEDKPYDRFVREQLAADEFAADDPDALIGTAFLRHGIYEYNQRNARMHWELIVNEMTNVTGEVFLGLGIGCAQCHDHKFDPILQKDYYALQSFLATTWWPEDQPLGTPEQIARYEKELAAWEKSTKEAREELAEMTRPLLEGKGKYAVEQFPEDIQAMYRKPAEERTPYEEQMTQLVERQVVDQQNRVDPKKSFAKDPEKLARYNELVEALKNEPEPLPTAFISTDISREPVSTVLESRTGKTEIEPAFLTLLGQPAPEIEPTDATTGRRLALADWIASEDNPLSTRVIVNRVWQRHFGTGLVPTPNDFGRLGEKPSHPELLDWLTKRFLDGEWKLKPLHRLVMTSATYRQTARREPTSTENIADSANRLLWRFPPQRLDAEQIRDAVLAVSGELAHREGGPSVEGDKPNRSVYVKKRRNKKDAMMGGFDVPSGFSSEPDRMETTTPNQSLMLVNGEFTLSRATAFAERILSGDDSIDADRVREAYLIAYGREALPEEVENALAFVEAQTTTIEAPAPEYKFPDENGLRPASQAFGEAEGIDLGENSLWLQPGSRFERLEAQEAELSGGEFTIEAVANLDGVHPDASVNTLFSRWNGSDEDAGWTFGVTSEKSRYQPRNFIMQLVGDDFQGNRIYEVVASDLSFPLGKPVYFAASVSAAPSSDDVTKGSVTFYLKDLSDPDSPLQTSIVSHEVVEGLKPKPEIKALIGGRDQKGHLWDGQLARLVVSKGALDPEQLLVNGGGGTRVLDWNFAGEDGEHPAPNTAWLRETPGKPKSGHSPQLLGAVTDFCHALLTSNEFLYLH
ncbi:MAG: PSD1 and planctomycete cytochrome C domain-containing protein [Verrucomicrobiales bacterium]